MFKRRPIMLIVAVTCAAAAMTTTTGSRTAWAAITYPGQCQSETISVALASGQPANQQISALYCTPNQPAMRVDVLVPGATYTSMYFNWPVQNYNFISMELTAGRAVLDIDRLGSGQSSQPVSTDITATVQAYVLHQVIAWARNTFAYGVVDVIGHSLGSMIAAIDASTWPGDPSALVLTGYVNANTADQQAAVASAYPAVDDPLFSGSGLDTGYITTKPGVRENLFYYSGNVDPSVVSYDEAHKNVVSGTELGTGIASEIAAAGSNVSDSITPPVLIIVGQEDWLYCVGTGAPDCANATAFAQYEQPYFTHTSSFTAESVPNTGHDLVTSPTTATSFTMINDWLATHW